MQSVYFYKTIYYRLDKTIEGLPVNAGRFLKAICQLLTMSN